MVLKIPVFEKPAPICYYNYWSLKRAGERGGVILPEFPSFEVSLLTVDWLFIIQLCPERRCVKRTLGARWNQLNIIGKISTVTIISLLLFGFVTILLGI